MIGAHVLAADRRVVERFRQAGALSRETAKQLAGLRGLQQRRLTHLLKSGVVRNIGSQTYYLDENAWVDYRANQRRVAWLVALAIAVVLLIVWQVGRWLGS